MSRKASLMRLLGAQVAVGPVVTRKSQGKSTNAQRTTYAHVHGIHAAREKQIEVCAKDISYGRKRGKYKCKNLKEQYNVAGRECRYVPTRGTELWRTWWIVN